MSIFFKKIYKMFSLGAIWVLWLLLAATLAHSACLEVCGSPYWIFPTDFFDESNTDPEEEDEEMECFV